MADDTESRITLNNAPLSAEEARAWDLLVEEGKAIREPILARRAAKHEENMKRSMALRGDKFNPRGKTNSKANSMVDIPVGVKRWIVSRVAGMSFNRACAASGTTWLMVLEAKARNEEVRCAIAAMEEHSRELMMAKARSIVEQSQEEGTKVSMAQTQVSMKILSSLDREHFGESESVDVKEEVQKAIGGGGFVINLISDAAKTAEAVPAKRPGRALVYTDV